VERNFPIPPGIYEDVCAIVQKKLAAGIYEPLNSSYRSWWFCILKKDGKALRLVHSLEPLNHITIQHSSIPPIPEHLAEQFGGRTYGRMLDLYVGYDETNSRNIPRLHHLPNPLWCTLTSYPPYGLDELSTNIPQRRHLHLTSRNPSCHHPLHRRRAYQGTNDYVPESRRLLRDHTGETRHT
jgi:hypothetical protein